MRNKDSSSWQPTLLFAVADPLFIQGADEDGGYTVNHTGSRYAFLAYLISDLYHAGVDVHIVQPHFRNLMKAGRSDPGFDACADLPTSRVHLACDRAFYYADALTENQEWLNLRISIAFQREILYRWIPEISPDLIQCHDWMCGLIPAAADSLRLPVLYSLSWLKNQYLPLGFAEDLGIDTSRFTERLYYGGLPDAHGGPHPYGFADLLLSGITAATLVNTSGGAFLQELAFSLGGDVGTALRRLLRDRFQTRTLSWICENSFSTDDYLFLYERILGRSLWGDRGNIAAPAFGSVQHQAGEADQKTPPPASPHRLTLRRALAR